MIKETQASTLFAKIEDQHFDCEWPHSAIPDGVYRLVPVDPSEWDAVATAQRSHFRMVG